MNDAHVLVYFGEDPSRAYQLVQWLDVLAVLDATRPVTVVLRDPAVARLLDGSTRLPVVTAESYPELMEAYAELDAKVVLYVNNSPTNFASLVDSRMLHVHINHGESDKHSMASNNAKAYDRVLVAGEAAVRRHTEALMELDTSRLVRVGRPQLDLPRRPLIERSDRRTILYAPTWEGDADYNDYTSLDVLGVEIVRAALAVPGARLVYKPHPKIVTSLTPAVAEAHLAVLELVEQAAAADPAAGHTAVVSGDILAVMSDCDLLVCDVSSVGLDWLYLCTDRPLVLTDRHDDAALFARDVPVSRGADVVTARTVADLADLLADRLEQDEHLLARHQLRRFYFDDLAVGESTVRFVRTVSDLCDRRDRLQGLGTDEALPVPS
ncbi:CDP-glycerol glycerophosphotransferase family protein [Nocardioides xinjiangensis]|uniref:CDP-glycerol glycerophosphotransferase family protein n=1 Tax=Nocardioides xinjiangensis TaxID=2817376 RepID=UPI001B30DD2E|nr:MULTISPECIES: CDP-glycerol glycerophosphotransferase family protein [unclassified Nocardioides]